MASKVNVKFVIVLSVVLVVLFGGAMGLLYSAVTKSGEDYIALGDKLKEEGDLKQAVKMYEKAVGHDRTNVEWLNIWLDNLLAWTPDSQVEYEKAYHTYYMGILRTLAQVQEYDAAAQRKMLEALYQQISLTGGNAEAWESLVQLAEQSYERLGSSSPEAEQIRRYIGLASLQMMLRLPEDAVVREKAEEHLEAAVAADPDDLRAQIGLVIWDSSEWGRARRTGKPEVANKHLASLETRLDALDSRFPGHPLVKQAILRKNLEEGLIGKATRDERLAALRSMSGLENETIEAYRTSEYRPLTNDLDELRRSISLLQQREASQTMLNLTELALSQTPDDPVLLFYRGQRLRDMGADEEAIEAFQTVIDLPDRPVSLRGMILSNFRTMARFEQAEAALRMWDRTQDATERAEHLDDAREFYAALIELVQGRENAPQSMLIESKIMIAEGRVRDAIQVLNELDTQTGRGNVEVKRLLASSLVTMGQTGAAREQYDVVTENAPWDVQGALAGSQLDVQLQDAERGLERLKLALRFNPDHPLLNERKQQLEVLAGNLEDVSDPVLLKIAAAQGEMTSGNLDEAKVIVDGALAEHGDDPRLLGMLIEIAAQQQDLVELTRTVDRALAAYPENSAFQRMRERISLYEIEDPDERIDEILGRIDAAPVSDLQKELQKYTLFVRMGDPERARQYLRRAEEINPEHPGVLDALFVEALSADDMARARQLANTASRVDADQCGGQLFNARLLLAEGDLQAAMAALQRGVEMAPYNPTAWRLLGQVQLQLGQSADAVTSLKRAYDNKPEDAENAEVYIRALAQLQRNREALEVARHARALTPNDPGLNDVWLVLEETAGDKQLALRERTTRFAASPNDQRNTISYVNLLIELEMWDQARTVVDQARASRDSLALAVQDARLLALSGNESVEEGQAVLKEYIAGLGADMDEQPYIAMAQYLLEFERADLALAAFRQAEEHQDPAEMQATRAKADYLFQSGDNEAAAEAYGEMLAAGVDLPDQYIALRAMESHTRMEDWAGAKAVYDREFTGEENDSRVLLLLSQILTGLGDRMEASRHIDRAVEIAPNDPRPFLVRAQNNMDDASLYRDVVRDLKQAITLQPTLVQGYLMLANLERRHGDMSAAITELRSCVEANPQSDLARQELIRYLLGDREFEGAQLAVQEAVRVSDNEVSWVLAAGDVYRTSADSALAEGRLQAARDLQARAATWYGQASELEPESREILRRYVKALLDASRENSSKALETLDSVGPEIQEYPGLIVLKARTLAYEGKLDEAKELAAEALTVVENGATFALWYNELKDLMPRAQMVEFMLSLTPPTAIVPVWEVYLARLRLPDFAAHDELIENLLRVENQVQDNNDKAELYSVLGTIYYANARYEEAAEAFADGLAVKPDDREFLNNLAFTLANRLGRLEEALEHAERAVALYPTDSGLLDTMGYIYLELGREGQAEQYLSRALTHATKPSERLPAILHQARVKLNQENLDQARRLLDQASDVLDQNPGLLGEYGPEFNELMERLDSAE